MNDPSRTNQELIAENAMLKQRILDFDQEISVFKRAEEELHETQMQHIIAFSPAITYSVTPDFVATWVTPNVESILGYTVAECLVPGWWVDHLHPDDRHCLIAEMPRVFADGQHAHEYRFQLKDGFYHWIHDELRLIRDVQGNPTEIIGAWYDITERKQAEKALRESEERYWRVLETSIEGIWITNEDHRITFANKHLADRLGYTLEEILGRTVDYFIFKEDLEDYTSKIKMRGQGVAEAFERRFRHKDGTATWSIASASPLFDGQGRFTGSFAMFTDITERKQAEEALRVSEQGAKRLAKDNELIAEIGRIISSTLDIEDVYQRFADKVREAIPFDRIAINTINMKDYTRTTMYVQGDRLSGSRIGEVVSLAETGIEHVIRTKSSLLINSMSTEDMRRKLLAAIQFGAESSMLIPLILKDEVIGSLGVHSFQIDAYSENDLRLAEKMASQIAGSIANAQLFRERTQVEEQLQHTLDSLRKSMSATIQVMVATVEARDPYTSGHQVRSAGLARAIATEMGLPQEKIDAIRMAGSIHDIGKISIPAEILSKPTKLSDIEFSLIKAHAQRGFEMLKDVESPWPLAEIVHQHHERMDGSGYPRNLKGDEILIEARILSVADVVEAMASHRPYRPGLGIDAALNEIEKNRGIFYAAAVSDACLRLFREKGFILEGT